MPVPSQQQLRALPDFANNVKWDLQFIRIPSGLVYPINFPFLVQSTGVPKGTNTGSEIWVRGNRIWQPGLTTPSETIELTAYETVDNAISMALRSWREMIWATGTGVQGRRKDVQADLMLLRLDRQHNPIWKYILYGAWLEDYDPTGGDLASEGSELLKPTLTIKYDYFDDEPL